MPDSNVDIETATRGVMGIYSNIIKRARAQHKLIDNFRDRWKREYLTALREHYLVTGNNNQNISIGDVVQINDDGPRSQWNLAVIQELITGNDGKIRAAVVKTKN